MKRAFLAVLVLALAAAGGYWLAWRAPIHDSGHASSHASSTDAKIEWLPAPVHVPDVSLATTSGAFPLRSLQGEWSLITFGYMSCPDACPTTLAALSHFVRAVRAQGVIPPRVLFISVDPRDSTGALETWVRGFDPAHAAATADTGTLTTLSESLGLRYAIAGDSIGHSTHLVVLDPNGQRVALIRTGFDPAALAAALLPVLKRGYPPE